MISDCGTYRYRLTRTWDDALPELTWVMLNPSTADAEQDDPTIRRCIGFAKAWGYGGIIVVNLYALRATDPRELERHEAPIGPLNGDHLFDAVAHHKTVAAWGTKGGIVARTLTDAMRRGMGITREPPVLCLGLTKDGHPRHPLYVPKAAEPLAYAPLEVLA